MNERLYLVGYDIASPRRWRRVVKAVRRVGERRQLSVFVCRMTARRKEKLERELRALIDPDQDRLMVLDLGPATSLRPDIPQSLSTEAVIL